VGSINSHRPLAGNIAVASGSRVLLIDYRLAPEHPLPAGIDDAVTVYKWLVDNGYQPRHIAVAGDSAGGGLALAMLVSLKERGLPQPGACVCLSPWTDLAFTGETWKTKLKADLILHAWKEVEFARMYLGGIDARSPLGSPLYADLKGLPPMLVQVGTDEVLLSDSTRLVERAKEAGVDAELDIWDRMQHVWQFAAGFIPESTRAVRQMGEFIEKRI
jgi:acetyl esterase/lipase